MKVDHIQVIEKTKLSEVLSGKYLNDVKYSKNLASQSIQVMRSCFLYLINL